MNLNLVLTNKWYNLIEKGEKTEEYREIKDYYINRLFIKGDLIYLKQEYKYIFGDEIDKKEFIKYLKNFINDKGNNCLRYRDFKTVTFSKGYTKQKMTFEINNISIDKGKSEWGADYDNEYFVIKLGKRIKE